MSIIFKSLITASTMLAFAAPASAQFLGLDNDGLLGGAVGAGIGGVIGSNLAAGDVQDEGTALGAVIGGLAGYAIASGGNNSRYGDYYGPGYSNGYGHTNYGYHGNYGNYGNSRYGYTGHNSHSAYGIQPHYMPSLPQPVPCGGYSGCVGPTYVHSGQYTTQTYPGPTYTYYNVVQPSYTYVEPVPAYRPAPPVITTDCSAPTIQPANLYCYPGSSALYDDLGRRVR